MITMPHIFLSRGGTAGEDNLQGFDENYWQDDGAGTPLKRSFIHLMAVGAASRERVFWGGLHEERVVDA